MASDLSDIPVFITSVSFHGLQRTSSEFLKKQIKNLVSSTSFAELINQADDLKHTLLNLQLFSSVSVTLDTDKSSDNPDAFKVDYFLQEKNPQSVKCQWTVDTDGSMRLGGHYSINNIFHKAERLEIDAFYSKDSYSLRGASFTKPLESNPKVLLSFGGMDGTYDHWWARFLRRESSVFLELLYGSYFKLHKLQLNSIWRQVQPSGNLTPWSTRLESSPSLKTSLRHYFEVDNRLSRTFPSEGWLLRATHEVAFIQPGAPNERVGLAAANQEEDPVGVDRSIQVRSECILQKPFRLFDWLTAEITFSSGIVHSLTSHRVSIADRFFLGGPLDLRGFRFHSIGPTEPLLVPRPVEGAASAHFPAERMAPIGALASCLLGGHLYTPLPFLGGGEDSFASLFRLHAFALAGSLIADPLRAISEAYTFGGQLAGLKSLQPRYVLGGGLLFKLVQAVRFEVNYCLPINAQPGDAVQPGFQFGIGLNYM